MAKIPTELLGPALERDLERLWRKLQRVRSLVPLQALDEFSFPSSTQPVLLVRHYVLRATQWTLPVDQRSTMENLVWPQERLARGRP